jgi:hypothetical protein
MTVNIYIYIRVAVAAIKLARQLTYISTSYSQKRVNIHQNISKIICISPKSLYESA